MADRPAFELYVEQLQVPGPQLGQPVLLDTRSVHKTEAIHELVEGAGCRLLFLPAYSPDHTLIE